MAYQVNITHFINPHLFYFCKINTSNYLKLKSQIERIEQAIECKVNKQVHPIASLGDEVAVFFLSWRRMIRARVDYIVKLKDRYEYTVWALDYGFPFQTNLNFVYGLPREFAGAPSHIKRGGFSNIMPAEKIFYNGEHKVRCTPNWIEIACTIIENLLTDCFSVDFVEDFQQDDHYWGDLVVTNNFDVKISLSTFLKENKYALAASKSFRSNCKNLPTIQISPWLNNSRNYTCKVNAVNTFLFTNETPKQAQLNADLTNDDIRKVSEWRCGNTSSDIEDDNETHLGMSVVIKNCANREEAINKFLIEKDKNEADNLLIFENYKDKLPQEALLALNPSLSFENKLVKDANTAASSAEKYLAELNLSDQHEFIESLKKRANILKQRAKYEGSSDTDQQQSTVTAKNSGKSVKRYKVN